MCRSLIPDRRAVSLEKKSPSAPAPQIYASAWRREQQATTTDPQPSPAPHQQEDRPACPGVPWDVPVSPDKPWSEPRKPEPAPGSAEEASPAPGPTQSTFANSLNPSEAPPLAPYAPGFCFVPDARGPFSNIKNPFVRPR